MFIGVESWWKVVQFSSNILFLEQFVLYNDPEIRHEVLERKKEKVLHNAIFKKRWEAMVFSWLERASGRGEASALLHTHEVEGSSPPVSTK